MQPTVPDERLLRMIRWLIGVGLAIAASAVPVTTVSACSCAMPGTLAESVALADLAFVGTVIDAAALPEDPAAFGPMFGYAFEVERASAASDAVTEIRAVGNDGGASCGLEFGIGERWFVVARRDGASLQTDLCSGNLLVDGLAPADIEQLVVLLPVEPLASAADAPAEDRAESSDLPPMVPAALGALAIVAIMVLAFRSGTPRSPG